jgi:hypothetical protein
MTKIQTISLEFLRHGPAHNQLLSPLTQYLGICGNYGASTVRVPYEHQEFLSRLESLRYGINGGEEAERRQFDLTKTAEDMAEVLASIPGLVSSLGHLARDQVFVTHLDLVLSASELAMLPFELAKVPSGCVGGEGNCLLLQTNLPLCLTRRVRSISGENIVWPNQPRILFIIAQFPNMSVPALEHTQALLKAIDPWVPASDPSMPGDRERKAGKILTILSQATMKEIGEACSENGYTHVHILAHGMENKKLPGSPYGLVLHNSLDKSKMDVVTGEQLASALRPFRRGDARGTGIQENATLPVLVSIAACDSGNVGSVIYNNGASLAHSLHRAGVPVVVASQFPLSKAGSVHVAQVLYGRALWGEDPRITLQHLRSRLHALSTDAHDWASLVAYAAFPENLEDQLKDVQYVQAKRAVDTAMSDIDRFIDKMGGPAQSMDIDMERFDGLFKRVDEAAKRMPTTGEYETEGTGVLASTEKRKAEACFRVSLNTRPDRKWEEFSSRSLVYLQKSLHCYEQAYRESMRASEGIIRKRRSLHWVMTQYLSLRAVLGEPFLRDHWGAAVVSADVDLCSREARGETVAWAHGTLSEIYLILLAYDPNRSDISREEVCEKVLEHAQGLLSVAGYDSFPVYSTERQFRRYIDWWGSDVFASQLDRMGRVRERPWTETGGLLDVATQGVRILTR